MRATAADVRRAIRMRRAAQAARAVLLVALLVAVCLAAAWFVVWAIERMT